MSKNIIKWRVTYKCYVDSEWWSKKDSIINLICAKYDLKEFANYAPAGWEIIKIQRVRKAREHDLVAIN
jgi:hypothetical protein